MNIRRGELKSVRAASRNLYAFVDELHAGAVEKFVLLDHNKEMCAVLVTAEHYDALAADPSPTPEAA